MTLLWILLIIGAYQLGHHGFKSFFGLEPHDRREAVADKWVAMCQDDDKKTARTSIHAVPTYKK